MRSNRWMVVITVVAALSVGLCVGCQQIKDSAWEWLKGKGQDEAVNVVDRGVAAAEGRLDVSLSQIGLVREDLASLQPDLTPEEQAKAVAGDVALIAARAAQKPGDNGGLVVEASLMLLVVVLGGNLRSFLRDRLKGTVANQVVKAIAENGGPAKAKG